MTGDRTVWYSRLDNADIIPYFYNPSFWLRWCKYWNNKKKREVIRGLDGRIGPFGFAISFMYAGQFHNGSHWFIFFRYRREWEEMSI